MDKLLSIMAERRADAHELARRIPLESLRREAAVHTRRSLRTSLAQPGTRIVAETKKASPSAGLLCADYDPAAIARLYAEAGAAGISVLTEPRHFLGEDAHLRAVRAACDLPVLRKDFISEPYQVAEAAAWGADVVLLIVAALDPARLTLLYEVAVQEFGLEVLAEAHSGEELAAAIRLPEAILGVNSRNLRTLKTDLGVARSLVAAIPAGRMAIAESGIRSRAEVEELERLGYRGFLIGESLLAAPDPAAKLRELAGG